MKTTKLRVSLNFHEPDTEIVKEAIGAYDGLNGNANFVNPPIALDLFKSAIDDYASKIAAARDGGRQAFIDRDQQRVTVIKMMRQLGHWVEANCKDDASILQSSGFQAVSNTRVPAQPLSTPVIQKVENGQLSGHLSVRVKPIPRALAYWLRYAHAVTDGSLGSWTELPPFTNSRPFLVTGLTPGTVYAFQVRALGKSGYTEWTDSATRMSI
jgi:hypothetical protein